MNEIDFVSETGETIAVEYEPVDYDDYGNIEFEISVFFDGKDVWDDLSSKNQHDIEAQVKADWEQCCQDAKTDAAINRWELNK